MKRETFVTSHQLRRYRSPAWPSVQYVVLTANLQVRLAMREGPRLQISSSSLLQARLCLDPKILHQKTSHQMFNHMHGVLNKIYLQNFFVQIGCKS